MYFTTTRLHQELAGGKFVDVIIDEAHDPADLHPFKGNIDLEKLERLIRAEGAQKGAYVSLAGTVNMAGGQPVSLANTKALRQLCDKHGISILLDAKRFYRRLDQEKFPSQTLAAELYLDTGVRGMERGIVNAGRDPQTSRHRRPALELTRLTIPRRVYTQAHMDEAAEAIKAVYDKRESTRGLKIVYEPKLLRFFQASFEPIYFYGSSK